MVERRGRSFRWDFMSSLRDLKHHAVASSLFRATTLGRAVSKLGFVQADPIRSPARAQDLILRQRVTDYSVDDLDRGYRSLKLEEDILYAYGFMPVATWQLLHPRGQRPLTATEQRVLEVVSRSKRLHPRELEASLGRDRETNAWGGYSKSTTRILEKLHYLGLIRISGRDKGVKLYQQAAFHHQPIDPEERLRRLALLITRILAPVPQSSLRAAVQRLRYTAPELQREIPHCCHAAEVRGNRECGGRRGPLSMASRPTNARRTGRGGSLPGAVRSGGVGPAQIRVLLGLALSIRGLYSAGKAQTWVLRYAVTLESGSYRMG